MENFGIWITISVGVVITVVGGILNVLITNKINEGNKRDDELEQKQKEDHDLIFKRIDDFKDNYVRRDIYDQSVLFNKERSDTKYATITVMMAEQFKVVDGKLEDLKELILKNFNNPKAGGMI